MARFVNPRSTSPVFIAIFAFAGCAGGDRVRPPRVTSADAHAGVAVATSPTDSPSTRAATRPTFDTVATAVLGGVLARNERDPALAPVKPQAVVADGGDVASVCLDYGTRDEWPDLPSKQPPGVTAGRGRVSVWIGTSGDRPGFSPFAPPKGCFYQRTVWSADPSVDGPVMGVVVYSMTAGSGAHGRLLAIVREELAKQGVTVRAAGG